MQRVHPLRSTLAVATLGFVAVACSSTRTLDVGPRAEDPFARLLGSPLLVDLPPASARSEPEPPPARPRIAGDERVQLELRGTRLGEAIHLIADAAGINMFLEAGLDQKVDAKLPDVTLDDALGLLLDRHGLRLREEPAGVFWVERADGTEPALETFELEYVRALDVQAAVQTLAGQSIVVVDTDRNVVMVRGRRGDANAIGEYLRAVDRLKQQVLIEISLFEVSMDDDFELGIDLAGAGTVNGNAFDVLSGFSTPGDDFLVNLTDDKGDFTATLNALRQYVGVELISAPKVMAVTNTEALIEIVTEIPYVETTSTTTGTTGGVGGVVQESVQFKEAGLRLTVLPTVQGDGLLQIQIHQELSEVIGEFNEIPILDTRSLTSQFMVEDRRTVVLGGLAQVRHSETDAGIPGLMHLPLVGSLFKSNDDTRVKRELMLFVTPRILAPNQAAALVPHFQDSYREERRILDPPVLGSGAANAR